MARTAPASHPRKRASGQHKLDPPRPPPCSARKGMVERCNECVASHTRCNRARPTCERCEKRGQACSWPDQEVEDPTGANALGNPFLPTTTTTTTIMNPPTARDNPALRLITALNATYPSKPSQQIAPSQSFNSSRLATTTTISSEPVGSPELEEDDNPLNHRGAPEKALNSSQLQTQRAPDVLILETSSVEDNDDMPADNNDRNRNETSLGYEQPRRMPGVIYMGDRRTGREVPLLLFLPR